MLLLVTDVFLLLTQVLLWILVALAARFVLLKALPKAFLGGLVLVLLVVVAALTFFKGAPEQGLLGDIWQIISLLFNPLGLILIFLAIVWRDAENKGVNATSKWLLRIAVAALILFSLPVFANFVAQRTELEAIQISQPDPSALPAGAQRVIVLMGQNTTRLKLRPRTEAPPAGSVTPEKNAIFGPPEQISEGRFSLLTNQPVQLTEQGDRILYAAQLYQAERFNSPLIIVSAGPRPGRSKKEGDNADNISEASDISRLLQSQFGIPGSAIIQDNDSTSVIESAQNTRKLLESRRINYGNQVMVVTSAIEMSRTALTFSNELNQTGQNVAVIARPTDFYTIPPKGSLAQRAKGRDLIERNLMVSDFLPSMDALNISTKVVGESLTSLYYFLRGWVRPLRAS
ncbi:YdcF family protein [Alkalinema pantanalense CENA528]|uniref:YdcF family protein n=1 Tax=Alkalinema pantanalense TaxID=1620705 RepID=UPI003D700DE7